VADGKAWDRSEERGSLFGLRFLVWCYRHLGRGAAFLLVDPIVAYFFLTDPRGRRASRRYLERIAASPEGRRSLGRRPDWWACYLHYRAFGVSIFDRLEIWFGRTEDFEIEAVGIEHMAEKVRAGQGALLIGAHLGSFDALRLLAAGHRQRPLTPDEEPARDLWELRGRILFAALRAAADEMAGDAADVRLERVLEVLPLCTQLHEQWAARSAALAAAGRQGAQGAKALRSLLDSGSATDRLVATALVELDKDSDAAEITPLADDKDHRVALAAGFAALKSGDRRGLDWLAGLLTAEEQLVRAQAAELLTAATGRSLGYSAFAEKIDRAAKAAAWKKWIEQNGAAVKLQPLRRPRR